MLPSKKLMIAVFNDIDYDQSFIQQPEYGTDVRYVDIHGNSELLDVYHVAHLMKEWANSIDKGDITDGNYGENKLRLLSGFSNESFDKYECSIDNFSDKVFYSDTEFEAVSKACEWILEQQNVSD